MKTFNLTRADGSTAGSIKYYPIQVVAGDVTHDLGLHQYAGEWSVSHLSTGQRVCRVHGLYKGIAVSTQGFTVAEIKRLARIQLDARVEFIGDEKFNRVIAEAVARVAANPPNPS